MRVHCEVGVQPAYRLFNILGGFTTILVQRSDSHCDRLFGRFVVKDPDKLAQDLSTPGLDGEVVPRSVRSG